MAVKIRMTRMGAKKKPFYRIVASDSKRARDGKYIELIGTYDPTTNPTSIKVNEELAMKWLENGAIPSDTVRNIFTKLGLMEKFSKSKAPKAKKETEKAVKEEKKEAPKKAAAKKAPAKKETAEKEPAKKPTAKKAPAKKTTTKKEEK